MTRHPIPALCLLAAVLMCASVGPAPSAEVSRSRLLAAEAAGAATAEDLELLFRGLESDSAPLRRQAVRALGRLERPSLVPRLLPWLSAPGGDVRAETAAALAQSAGQDLDAARVGRQALLGQLRVERDEVARAGICEALGRLPLREADEFRTVETALLEATRRPAGAAGGRGDAPSAAMEGALRGFESLVRLRGKLAPLSPGAVERLRSLVTSRTRGGRSATDPSARLRRLALLVLNAAGVADGKTLAAAGADADEQVRRIAAAAATLGREGLQRALADASPMVRYEGLRSWGRRFQAAEGCGAAVKAAEDASPHVALLALDQLGGCPGDAEAVSLLTRDATPPGPAVASPRPAGEDWHRRGHALVALARLAPDRASGAIAAALTAEPWQLRMYAAQAATLTGTVTALRALAADGHANVREAAISGLSKAAGHDADDIFLASLEATDAQLVMTAARALAGTPARSRAVTALLAALSRFTAGGADTSRDPRLALLERVRQLGSADRADAIRPYLSDFDPRVADLAARTLTEWTGAPHEARPTLGRSWPVPDEATLKGLEDALLRVTMRGLGTFDVRLRPDEAPLACTVIARLAREGYYDGLTFHRVVPNFLVQGGSPGANEYAGHPRFMRDELGRLSHTRGAVGVSTRGRHTGDAQIYVDTIDVPRLDHEYTVFAEVVRGMEVVDAMLEGAVIDKVELIPRPGR